MIMSHRTSSEESNDPKVAPDLKVQELPTVTSNYVAGDAFAGGGSVELYEPVPEYEGRHRYDPKAEWTEKEERRLVRRVGSLFESHVSDAYFE